MNTEDSSSNNNNNNNNNPPEEEAQTSKISPEPVVTEDRNTNNIKPLNDHNNDDDDEISDPDESDDDFEDVVDNGPGVCNLSPTVTRRVSFVLRIVILSLLLLHVLFSILLAIRPNEWNNIGGDDGFENFKTGVDAQVIWGQFAAALVSLVLHIMSVVIGSFRTLTPSTALVIYIIQGGAALLEIFNLAFPTTYRTTIVILSLVNLFIEYVLMLWFFQNISKYGQWNESDTVLPDDNTLLIDFAKLTSKMMTVHSARYHIRRKERRGRLLFGLLALTVVLLALFMYGWEFLRVLTSQGAIIDSGKLRELTQEEDIFDHFPSGRRRLHDRYRVFFVVVDGLRYDRVQEVEELHDLVFDESIRNDSLFMESTAQLPSMSVPNWLTTVTGAPPEVTGQMGNLGSLGNDFDNFFRMARIYQTGRGLTGSPWWTGVVGSDNLPTLIGDGTVPTSADAEKYNRPTADGSDWLRYGAGLKGLSNDDDYEVFLTHFSDVDMQGHCCGVSTEWNQADTYNDAVRNKTAMIEDYISQADNRTIIIVTADHGHVLRGGHGGIRDTLTRIPLFVYLRDSNIRNQDVPEARFRDQQDTSSSVAQEDAPRSVVENMDYAATVTALLGLPAPRSSLGMMVDDMMPFLDADEQLVAARDLFRQKQAFVAALLDAMNEDIPSERSDLFEDGIETDMSYEECVTNTRQLVQVYFDARSGLLSQNTARNVITSLIISVFILLLLVATIWLYTSVQPVALFSLLSTWVKSRSLQARPPYSLRNTVINLWSFFAVAIYYALTIGTFLICYTGYGFWDPADNTIWDSTYIHTPAVVVPYFCFVLIPAIVWWFVVSRVLRIYYINGPAIAKRFRTAGIRPKIMACWMVFVVLIMPTGGRTRFYRDFGGVYLFTHFFLLWSVISALFIMLLAASFTFIVPSVFRINFVTEHNWQLRFRVLTTLLMSLPLLIFSAIDVIFRPPVAIGSKANDQVFLMSANKFKDDNVVHVLQDDEYKMARTISSAKDGAERVIRRVKHDNNEEIGDKNC